MTSIFTIVILGFGEIVDFVLSSITLHPDSRNFIFIGLIGIIGISLAVLTGVWFGLRIGIGIEIKQHQSYLWWVVNRLLFLTGVTTLGSFIIFFLQEKFHEFKLEQAIGPASRLILVVGIFVLLTALFSGWLADRFGKKKLILISGLLAAIGSGIVVASPTLLTTYIGGSIIGIGAGLFYTSNWALGTQIVPKEKAGQFLGFSNLAGAGAGAIGAYIGGPIADFTSYTLLMSLSGCLALLSILPLLKIADSD
jgi:MFS family permease